MKIAVIGMNPKAGDCWEELFKTLDEGQAEGVIEYTVIDHWDAVDDAIKAYDGAIYCDVDVITEDIPFFALTNCDYTEEEFFDFISTVHEYVDYRDGQGFVDAEINQTELHEQHEETQKAAPKTQKKPKMAIPLDDIVCEITEDEIKKLAFKAVTVVVGGKDVKLDTREFIALSKMVKIIEKFGYKVKNVIV